MGSFEGLLQWVARKVLSEEVLTGLSPARGQRWPCRIGAVCPRPRRPGRSLRVGTGWQLGSLDMVVPTTSFLLSLNGPYPSGSFTAVSVLGGFEHCPKGHGESRP